jgi:hypothetical protein
MVGIVAVHDPNGVWPMEKAQLERIAQLEGLVSSLRHDLRGIITSGALIADYMQGHSDPGVQRCAKRIAGMIARILARLDQTYDLVPPRGGSGLIIG